MMNDKINYFGYWIAIAHLSGWGCEEINSLIVDVVHNHAMQWSDFFALGAMGWTNNFNLSQKQINTLQTTNNSLANTSFYAEDLLSQGYKVLPLNAPEYPSTAKKNLGRRYAPPVLYVKGNLALLNTSTVAIMHDINSTNHIDVQQFQNKTLIISSSVVKQTTLLDQHLASGGKSIILLPCGIKKYPESHKRFYKNILSGNLLIASPFFPDNPENTQSFQSHLMIIRGMADKIVII